MQLINPANWMSAFTYSSTPSYSFTSTAPWTSHISGWLNVGTYSAWPPSGTQYMMTKNDAITGCPYVEMHTMNTTVDGIWYTLPNAVFVDNLFLEMDMCNCDSYGYQFVLQDAAGNTDYMFFFYNWVGERALYINPAWYYIDANAPTRGQTYNPPDFYSVVPAGTINGTLS